MSLVSKSWESVTTSHAKAALSMGMIRIRLRRRVVMAGGGVGGAATAKQALCK